MVTDGFRGFVGELKTTQNMRYEKVILAVVCLAAAVSIWLLFVK